MEPHPLSDHELTEQMMGILREKGDRIMRADLDQVQMLLARMTPESRSEITPWVFEGLFLQVNAPGYDGDLPEVDKIPDPFDEGGKFVRRKGLRLRQKHIAELEQIMMRVGPELHPRITNSIAMIVEHPDYDGDIPADQFRFDISAYDQA
jgi:hypothetical protein